MMRTTGQIGLLAMLFWLAAATSLQAAEKKKEAEPIVTVNRYLGFRAASDVTKESDYTFKLFADGTWHYKALVGGYEKKGDLGKGLAAWRKKLAKTGLPKLKPPKKPPLAIADAPAFSITWKDGEKTRKAKLSPRDKVADAVHKLVQNIRNAAEEKKKE